MRLEEQVHELFSYKNRRLPTDWVKWIQEVDAEALSCLEDHEDLYLEASLLLQLKLHMEKVHQIHPRFPEAFDEYYIAFGVDKFDTPIALVCPIGRFIYNHCFSHSIMAIGMDYERDEYVIGKAYADIEIDEENCFHIHSLEVKPPLNQKGVGGFIFVHIAPIAKSMNAFIEKHLQEDGELPAWLKTTSRYKAITAYARANELIIPQSELKKFYSKRGCRLSAEGYLYKEI